MSEITLRMTRQRHLIMEELAHVKTHPTAYEVHGMVKKVMPQISLGTVYRNLEQLSNNGKIKRLAFGNGKRRYDGNVEPHHHLCCQACGRVDDLPPEAGIEEVLGAALDEVCGYRVTGVSVEVYGRCPACREKEAQALNKKTKR